MYKRTIKIPIHYNLTKSKLSKLDKLTARLSYGVQLFLETIKKEELYTRTTLTPFENQVRNKTKLSSAFVQQCKDKAIWMYKSYKKQYQKWQNKCKYTKGKYKLKLLKREPSFPTTKQSRVRLDYRTATIKKLDLNLSKLWLNISTLKKHNKILIPLNPAIYHLNSLGRIIDCELVKRDKYYLHITCEYHISRQSIKNIRSIDLGINRSVTTVLLTPETNQIKILKEKEKKHKIEKLDNLISKLQNKGNYKKLKQIREKRKNFIEDQERKLAKYIATISQESLVAIGYPKGIKYGLYKGNGNKKLRKKINKWAYNRIINYITQACEKQGIEAIRIDEYNTSKLCSQCQSKDTKRPYKNNYSLFKCKNCGKIMNSDVNACYNIARRAIKNKSLDSWASDEHALPADDLFQKRISAETSLK
jgi:putative transposase